MKAFIKASFIWRHPMLKEEIIFILNMARHSAAEDKKGVCSY